ncbi:MAG: M23 family metallopeptidase, partial [Firmicutes bacterium]|nr:M23 family metallopeptidase [Bacillota bacterium]
MRTFFSKYWSYALTVGVFVISGFLSYVAYTFIVSGSAEYVFEEVSTNIVACIEKNSIECGADTTDYFSEANKSTADNIFKPTQKKDEKYIKWVDFKISLEALNQAYNYDVKSWSAHKTENKPKLCWIELLAYSAAKTGNNFRGTKCKHISAFAKAINDGVVGSAKSEQGGQGEQVKKGENYPNENTAFPPTKESVVKELTKDLKFYNYYHKAFSAVLENFLGEYHCVRDNKTEYGLLVYHPIAKGYGYSSARDFGNARAFGFKRKHLGNDFFGRTGTPIIAVEGGTIHEAGWNRYGGWRIGI